MNEERQSLRTWPVFVAGAVFLAACVFRVILESAETGKPPPLPHPAPLTAPRFLDHTAARSSQWAKVRAEHLEREPACAVCGSTVDAQVHHVLSFRFHPERELDPANLLTLCGPKHQNHHLIVGHGGLYAGENPHCREDAALLKQRYEESRRIAREGEE